MSLRADPDRDGVQAPRIAFSTPAGTAPWKRWLVYSPVARILIFSALIAVLVVLLQIGLVWLGWSGKDASTPQRAAGWFLKLVMPTLGAYLFLVYVVERRRPAELAWRKVVPDGAMGMAVGTLLISAAVLVLWLLGSYQVIGINAQAPWLTALLVGGLASGMAEELALRGVLFRITEEGLGTWSALALSALVFGILHLGNPGATTWSAVAIAIEAGLLLGLIYHVSRSLPLCIGVHLAWNFAQGTIYGIPVSGGQEKGWLLSSRSGPDWLSGGSFGAEASVAAVGVSLLCSLALLAVALRRHTIVAPNFARPAASTAHLSAG